MLRTYDPKKVSLSVGGVPLSGYADGSFISVEMSNDAWSKSVGADGQTTRAKSNDKSGTITVTFAQSSASNDYLSSLALLDEKVNLGVRPAHLADVNGTTILMAPFAWVRKLPSSEFSKEVSNREWALDCADLNMFVGSNNVQVSA
jgi:hypothetical protein